ncbi:MAG: hypothetical protein H6657_23300 [Ardenticatenaceae bacterium]|nr:hypothetical protein [Anaerolineales bacterium]MCB8980350.1 hypothetical protein [Ardenticatenaceae bacterium]
MLVKRLGVAIVSLLIGFGLTILITFLIGTTLEEYGPIYTFFTSFSIGCAIAIWLDKFAGTEMLPK